MSVCVEGEGEAFYRSRDGHMYLQRLPRLIIPTSPANYNCWIDNGKFEY